MNIKMTTPNIMKRLAIEIRLSLRVVRVFFEVMMIVTMIIFSVLL